MSKHAIAITTMLATALAASSPAAAEVRAELAGGYSSAAEAFAGVQAGAAIEKMTGDFSCKLSAGGEGTYAFGGELSGEASAAAQASVSLGQAVIL